MPLPVASEERVGREPPGTIRSSPIIPFARGCALVVVALAAAWILQPSPAVATVIPVSVEELAAWPTPWSWVP